MKCWICGEEADSDEHRIKASDLRLLFGRINSNEPVYIRSGGRKRRAVDTVRSKRMTFHTRICRKCNNQLTQPYDMAWEAMSEYLVENIQTIARQRRFDFSRIFPGSTRQGALDTHLYFVKLFGLLACDNNIPLDLNSFANAIRARRAHPSIYLSFILRPDWMARRDAAITSINAVLKGEVPAFVSWCYRVGGVIVDVVYSLEPAFMAVVKNHFHPNRMTKSCRLGSFKVNYPQPYPSVLQQ